jgi:hypothetical protein
MTLFVFDCIKPSEASRLSSTKPGKTSLAECGPRPSTA